MPYGRGVGKDAAAKYKIGTGISQNTGGEFEMKKVLTAILAAAVMVSFTACGQDNNTESITGDAETVRDDNNMDYKETEVDPVKTDENAEAVDAEDTSSMEDNVVPWDEMAPLNILTLPIGDTYHILEEVIFFPDILFPAEYGSFDGGLSARLDGKEYSVFAYAESHLRNVKSGGGELYYAEVGEHTIYANSFSSSDIHLKNNARDYQINISLIIMGADDELKAEYITKNCDYIKEQLEALDNGTDTTQTDGQPEIDYNNIAEIDIDGIYGMYQHTDNTRAVTIGIEYYSSDWGGPFNVTVDGEYISCGNEWKPLNENTIVVNNENAVLVATFYENGMDISVMEANNDIFYVLEGSYVLTESWNDIS